MVLLQSDYKKLIELLETGLVVVDAELRVLLWNPWIARTSGIKENDALQNPLPSLFPKPPDQALLDAINQATQFGMSRRLSHQLHPHLLPLYQRQSDQPMHHSIMVQPVSHEGQQACLMQITDVSSTVRREQHLRSAMDQVRHLAHHDMLTGLANRILLSQKLQDACKLATRSGRPFALYFIDLDGFKGINDRYGHDAGDALLRELAQRLMNHLNEGATAARLGGDELVALLPAITSNDKAMEFAESLCNLMAQPFIWQNNLLQVGASIGVALWPEQGCTPDDLLNSADNAMYLAKARGKGRAVYADELGSAYKKATTSTKS